MNFDIGESTLETLPGTLTPPTPIYSPLPKLTDDCISITSTPRELNKQSTLDFHSIRIKNIEVLKPIQKHVHFAQFKTPQLKNVSKKVLRYKKIIAKRKKMYMWYKLAKAMKPTDKIQLRKRKVMILKKVNVGDLI